MDAWLLHAAGREHRSEVYDIELPKGVDQRTEPHLPGTEELIVCVKGRVRVGPYDQEIELAPGDAAWFTADVAHHYVALRDARTLCWMIYPTEAAGGRR
jgi:quercetin dioxygenase-like cupin family protein